MPIDITAHLDRLTRRVEEQEFTGAAARMAERLSTGAASAMGGDLTFSGGAGTVRIDGEAERGRAVVTVGGAYGLADKGRQQAVPAKASGRAMRTPYGPRKSVRGSTWGGFGITQQHGREALREGARAAVDELQWGR